MKGLGLQRGMYGSALARRLIVGIILASSAITLCLTVLQLYGDYHDDLAEIEADFRQIEQVHLKSLSASLGAVHEQNLKLQLEGITRMPNLEYIGVREGGRLRAEAGRRISRDVIERQYAMTYERAGLTPGLATLTVVAGLDSVYHRLIARAFTILASNALKTFLVAGFAFALFYWLVNRHLYLIAKYLREFDLHDHASLLILARTAGYRSDELDEVVTAINVMHGEARATLAKLHVSEARLQMALDDAHMGIFDWDLTRKVVTWSKWHHRLWGYMPGEFGGTIEAASERVHRDDLPGINAELARCMAAHERFEREFRVVWPDHSVHWVHSIGEYIFDADGRPVCMRGTVMDITERKASEQNTRNSANKLLVLSRKLLQVQEDERSRLARDLHDQVGQALTALKINMQVIQRQSAAAQVSQKIEECVQIADETLQQVRTLVFDLRPPQLDELDLSVALRTHAERLLAPANLALHFSAPAVLSGVPKAIDIVCFRIMQEALTNILRHARARNVWIALAVDGDALKLEVRDDGAGFDLAEAHRGAMHGNSVGLLSMEERAALVDGRIGISTAPGAGTTVSARFPFQAEQAPLAAA